MALPAAFTPLATTPHTSNKCCSKFELPGIRMLLMASAVGAILAISDCTPGISFSIFATMCLTALPIFKNQVPAREYHCGCAAVTMGDADVLIGFSLGELYHFFAGSGAAGGGSLNSSVLGSNCSVSGHLFSFSMVFTSAL